MKHHDANRKFGRPRRQRKALLSSLADAMIAHERITTTEARAKELRPHIEKMVSKARGAGVAERRLLASRLGGKHRVSKLCDEIAPRYAERPGGYTRITKLPRRRGDASPMAVIEFV